MKKTIICLILSGGILLAGCSKDKDVDAAIDLPQQVEQQGVAFPLDKSSQQVTFTTTRPWSVSIAAGVPSDVSWLTVSPAQGPAGEAVLQLDATTNTSASERTATVSILIDGMIKSFKVAQEKAPDLAVIPDDQIPGVIQSESFFIVNEDWFGHQNGTVNRLWMNGQITYRAYRKANPGWQLGVTTQFGMTYGGNIYFMSKQGQRFVVADAKTLQKKASFTYIGTDGVNGGDGRACVGVDEKTVYVGTNSGIWIFDIPSLSFTGKVKGIDSDSGLYTGQTGDMVRIANRVFALMQGKGVLVIDTRTHSVETVIEPNTTGGLCQSKNGWLWVSGNPLKAYDPYTLEVKREVALPAEDSGGPGGWGAWRACSLCSSVQQNAVYWQGQSTSAWGSAAGVYKYDIDQQKLLTVMTLNNYGRIRIEPLTGYIVSVSGEMYNDEGRLRKQYTILGGSPNDDGTIGDENTNYTYWFATLPVFEDANPPFIPTNQIILAPGESKKICLSDLVVDHDNFSKSILKEVEFEPNQLVESSVEQDTLYLKASTRTGQTNFTLKVNSNGLSAKKNIRLDVR